MDSSLRGGLNAPISALVNQIFNEDCLVGMDKIPDKSIDMILCDLPYGTTKCKWDAIIPFRDLWRQYNRIIKDNGAIVLTAVQPFASELVASNPKLFKQELIWLKTRPSNFLNAKKMFMNWHENILIFYKHPPVFNRPMKEGRPRKDTIAKVDRSESVFGKTGENHGYEFNNAGLMNPTTILEFSNPNHKSLHPTQKPVALFEYLVKLYTNEGALVLDNCIGSGTTAIACIRTNRNFIGFETDVNYFNIACDQIRKAMTSETE